MPVSVGFTPPGDEGSQYDFSRVGGFRVANLTDLQKAQLLHRVGDWAQAALGHGFIDHHDDPRWQEEFLPLLQMLMKAANQLAIYIDNDELGWDRHGQ